MAGANSNSGGGQTLHATAIAVDGRAALLFGPSGAGKSDLALRCLMVQAWDGDRSIRAALVADDCVQIEAKSGRVICRSPATIAGLIEVRGIGVVAVPAIMEAEVVLAVHLTTGPVERMPDPADRYEILDLAIPSLRLNPFEGSAALKVLLALTRARTLNPANVLVVAELP